MRRLDRNKIQIYITPWRSASSRLKRADVVSLTTDSMGANRDVQLSRTRMSCCVCQRILDRLLVSILRPTGGNRGSERRVGAHMTPSCPRCHTAFVVPRRRTQATATALGGAARAIQAASSAIADAKRSRFAKEAIYPLGVVACAILGGLIGGVAGYSAGPTIGAPLDQALSNNFLCQACGHVFDASRNDSALT
jgi:hypothetical protein